ncbi:hypothetical protein AUC68_06330 [Methyloceanibacter methanicus]|uniref:Uncharacterized protein n=2 Tax=Methyloceanibacter methanicus TaxID=1774968 RepID=A0A1E3VZ26_9HYPH|nr:hypothetical protein AUC68_06330 [Methyloceanibacter methanicus]
MHRLVSKAFAFGAASRAAMSAASIALAAFASRARTTAAPLIAALYAKTVLRARWLRGRAVRLPRPVVRLAVASTALVLTLAALALPGRSDGRILASVELTLGTGAAGTTAVEIPVAFPVQAVAAAAHESTDAATTAGPEVRQPASELPTKEPNLAGLAEIPEELMVDQPERKPDTERRTASFAAFSEARENLPWSAAEPVVSRPWGPVSKRNRQARRPLLPDRRRSRSRVRRSASG